MLCLKCTNFGTQISAVCEYKYTPLWTHTHLQPSFSFKYGLSALFLSPSLTCSLTHLLTHSHPHSLTPSLSLSLARSLPLSLPPSLSHSLSLSLTLSHILNTCDFFPENEKMSITDLDIYISTLVLSLHHTLTTLHHHHVTPSPHHTLTTPPPDVHIHH